MASWCSCISSKGWALKHSHSMSSLLLRLLWQILTILIFPPFHRVTTLYGATIDFLLSPHLSFCSCLRVSFFVSMTLFSTFVPMPPKLVFLHQLPLNPSGHFL